MVFSSRDTDSSSLKSLTTELLRPSMKEIFGVQKDATEGQRISILVKDNSRHPTDSAALQGVPDLQKPTVRNSNAT